MAGSRAGVGGRSCRAIEWSLAPTRWRSSARKMYLTQLRLVNLRNHRRTELQLAQGVNVFVGANAQGKSTVLEAVELAATGRSPRATRETELISWGESWARVHATSRRVERDEEVDLAFRQDASSPRGDEAWTEVRGNGGLWRRGASTANSVEAGRNSP